MGSKLADKLAVEREQTLTLARNIERAALEADRDLNDDDIATITRSKERISKIDAQLLVVSDNLEMDTAMQDRLARLAPGVVEAPVQYRTAGELFWDWSASMTNQSNSDTKDGARRWGYTMKRAAEHMGTTAAATTPTAGGFGGLYVSPVFGPVIDLNPRGRPFVNLVGQRDAPNSMTFLRPRIVDPSFASGGAAVQTLEKAELVSKHFDLLNDPISLKTVGGYLNLSQQAISFIPSALDTVIDQLSRRVAYQTEVAALTEAALTTSKVTLAAGAAASAVLKALYDAAVLVFQKTGDLPTWLVAGPLGWAMLGSLVDAAGRPLFPWLGPANAMGRAELTDFSLGPLGLEWAVTPAITDTKMYMGNSTSFETYGYRFPVLEAVEPSVLGRQVAVAEAVANYRPITNETGPARDGVVLIGP